MLKVAKEVYFDATFKVVPGIYYQLLRVFAACGDNSDCCEVCLLQPREGVARVPCGHSRFCGSCADTVASLDRGCPICRTPIHMVLRLYGKMYTEWTVTSSKEIGVILSWFFNEYATAKDICAYKRFMCIPLQCLHKTIASLL